MCEVENLVLVCLSWFSHSIFRAAAPDFGGSKTLSELFVVSLTYNICTAKNNTSANTKYFEGAVTIRTSEKSLIFYKFLCDSIPRITSICMSYLCCWAHMMVVLRVQVN